MSITDKDLDALALRRRVEALVAANAGARLGAARVVPMAECTRRHGFVAGLSGFVTDDRFRIASRGRSFAIESSRFPRHAQSSVWTFHDEASIVESCWDVRPGDMVIDVGAAFGGYTLPALACGAARVIAFEPAPVCLTGLARNLALNPGFGERCVLLPYALSDENKSASLAADLRSRGCDVTSAEEIEHDATTQFVRLDDLVQDLGLTRLDFMKIDAEAAEPKILRGALETLRRFRPRMIIEDHTRPIAGTPESYRAEVESLLREAGLAWHHIPFEWGQRDYWLAYPAGEKFARELERATP